MLFNSFDFAIFLPLVFILYWFIFNKQSISIRNIFLLTASYIFYAFWDWRFLVLILFSSVMDFFLAHWMGKLDDSQQQKRKYLLWSSLVFNLGILGFFKYFNFFVDSFVAVFTLFGTEFNYLPLQIILPVGISFYTFQSLSYTIDVYYKRMQPTDKLVNFMTFVSFFPQLVAGPIERAQRFLPQFAERKTFDYQSVFNGLGMVLFGLFKKVVIADRLAVFIDQTYGNIADAQGIALVMAVIFFAFQLYIDFSAYSAIAIGSARMLGFGLTTNFRRPYLSSSFGEFWTRWHITLSSWFRDYVYIPLGGNRKGVNRKLINLMIVFMISGLWHGASWNFVVWGALNGFFVIAFDNLFRMKTATGIRRWINSLFIFTCWALSLIFFRAETFSDALAVFGNIGFQHWENLYNFGLNSMEFNFSIFLILLLMIYEIVRENANKLLSLIYSSDVIRWSIYVLLLLSIIFFGAYGASNDNSFIYFQF